MSVTYKNKHYKSKRECCLKVSGGDTRCYDRVMKRVSRGYTFEEAMDAEKKNVDAQGRVYRTKKEMCYANATSVETYNNRKERGVTDELACSDKNVYGKGVEDHNG